MLFIPLEKINIKERLVYGTIAAEEVDRVGEILDYATAKAAFQKWSEGQHKASGGKSYGNVRSMHNRTAAGKVAQPLHFDDELKKISACVYVSDDTEWQKIQDGVFTGFSPGGGYAKVWQDGKHKRYTPVIVELSLVDVPCQPSATFACTKADGTEELRKFKNADELGDIEQGFRAKDGRFFKAKVACSKWNEFIEEMAKLREEAETAVTHPALEALHEAESAVDKLAKAADPDEEDDEEEEDEEKAAADKKDEEDAAQKVVFKKGEGYDLQKGFCNIARLASIIDDLAWLLESCEYERESEKDDSKVPAELEAAIKTLVAIMTAMVVEEGKELEIGMAEKTIELPNDVAGRLSKMIGAEHAIMKKIKAIEPAAPQPSEELTELRKSLDSVTGDLAAERKVTSELTDGVTKLTKRLEALERQPVAPRGPLRAVDRHTERLPAPELKKESASGTDTLKMPQGLSPKDQRAWLHNQQIKH